LVEPTPDEMDARVERFADIQILQCRASAFQRLDPKAKKLIYCLYQAALCGRDIIWDQNFKFNLLVRRTLEEAVRRYAGPRDDPAFERFMTYVKRVWFANGVHHHDSGLKLKPGLEADELFAIMDRCPDARWPIPEGWGDARYRETLQRAIFDPEFGRKKVEKSQDADKARDSAVNYYEGVSEAEATAYQAGLEDPGDPTPPSHGLNSKLVKRDGCLTERVWRVGGMYGPAIERMVDWLERARAIAPPKQAAALAALIDFYRTGDLRRFDAYSVAWVEDVETPIDLIHGFIEVYNDPLGYRGAYEAMVMMRDEAATARIAAIAAHAQWFEDRLPVDDAYRKPEVKGVAGAVVDVVVAAGDSAPASPIGVNLPNADWIRERHGSKSVNLANLADAHRRAMGPLIEEFAYSEAEVRRHREYGALADHLHTDLHEAVGHASGRLAPGAPSPAAALKSYASTLEEARADLVALYFLMDPKLVELGLAPSLETGKAAYDHFIRNGLLVQLRRLEEGEDLEEDHLRNRQLIAAWAFEHGREAGVIERRRRNGKTYFVIRDYDALRDLFGDLLREVQRIKSEGDYEAGRALVEHYGVKADPELRREARARAERLDLAPYSGFLFPQLEAVGAPDDIRDVTVVEPESFTAQMMHYAARYAFLPVLN